MSIPDAMPSAIPDPVPDPAPDPVPAAAPPRPLGTITTMAIYPEKDRPGDLLTECLVETAGLEGDRRKKRPVHVVGREETPETTRANLFLDVSDARLREAVGRQATVGGAVLVLDRLPSNCAGVYASVLTPGLVSVGDELLLPEVGVDTAEPL